MEKKGQAAMEFLMTYGWAIIAAMAAIVVLAYFGFFNPNKYQVNEIPYYSKYCSDFCEYYNLTCNNPTNGKPYCYKLVNDTITEKRDLEIINSRYVFLYNETK